MPTTIALVADPHFALQASGRQHCTWLPEARYLLQRIVEYVNITGGIDLLCVAGDVVVDDGDTRGALGIVKAILDKLPCPYVVIPGDRDQNRDAFAEIFPLPEHLDLPGVRVIPFADPTRPGDNAERLPADIARTERLCRDFRGRVVALQHLPLFPPGAGDSRCGYVNAAELCAQYRRLGIALSISGHDHLGLPTLHDGGCSYHGVPGLCESPYPFQLATLADDGRCSFRTIKLRHDQPVHDCHTHSRFAYCCDDLDVAIERRLMDMLNIERVAVTEHSGHLFFTARDYWSIRDWFRGSPVRPPENDRSEAYLQHVKDMVASDPRFLSGLEVDIDHNGQLLINDRLRQNLDFLIGSIHFLDDPKAPEAPDQFLFMAEKLMATGVIRAIAHPYRVFTWDGVGCKPAHTFDTMVAMLKRYNVAAELSFHHNRPSPEFFRKCLDAGVKISFGSDTHSLFKLGFFNPHFDFLRSIGYDGDFQDIALRL
ncbi:metallophosphoesterase [Oligosphaera ethanolica]|uniref:Histidinol phosphatase-like PHP family hydrolase n=1 Tax=Oligosphaera ethanolica TaxID=760260 RepID=A0AAE3VG87_9BACT|nr:metallophosphoesterase [Oligosphaera ethanolica]MDQ0289718.1 histidinol phosphatase-like PHP family hydrolase [Oligosphaera ethanolica]